MHSFDQCRGITSLVLLDNDLLASGSLDGTISIINFIKGELKYTFQANYPIFCLCYLNNGILASATNLEFENNDYTVSIWSVS